MSLLKGGEIPKSNTQHANLSKLIETKQHQQKKIRNQIKNKVDSLAAEVVYEYIQRKPYRASKGDFTEFPSRELVRALN